jgi:hypothetical protein
VTALLPHPAGGDTGFAEQLRENGPNGESAPRPALAAPSPLLTALLQFSAGSGAGFAEQLRENGPDGESAPQTAAAPAAPKMFPSFKIYLPSAGAGDSAALPVNGKKAPARRSMPQAMPGPTANSAAAAMSAAALSETLAQLPLEDASAPAGAAAAAPTIQLAPVAPAAEPASSDNSQPTAQTGDPPAGGSSECLPELAFATRVQPVQSVDQSALPAEMAAAAAVASASKKVAADAAGENDITAGAHALPQAAMAVVERDAPPASPSSPAAPAAATGIRNAEAPAHLAPGPLTTPAPLKDISLQVTQPGNQRVEVRVVQQGSEVRVSVHSGDAILASGLRQGLSELQGRLEENGYRAEMWRPAGSAAPLTPTPGAHAAPGQSRGGDAQPQSGGSQQNGGRRNPQQSNQPRWVEELESSLTGGEKSIGGSYGVSS